MKYPIDNGVPQGGENMFGNRDGAQSMFGEGDNMNYTDMFGEGDSFFCDPSDVQSMFGGEEFCDKQQAYDDMVAMYPEKSPFLSGYNAGLKLGVAANAAVLITAGMMFLVDPEVGRNVAAFGMKFLIANAIAIFPAALLNRRQLRKEVQYNSDLKTLPSETQEKLTDDGYGII